MPHGRIITHRRRRRRRRRPRLPAPSATAPAPARLARPPPAPWRRTHRPLACCLPRGPAAPAAASSAVAGAERLAAAAAASHPPPPPPARPTGPGAGLHWRSRCSTAAVPATRSAGPTHPEVIQVIIWLTRTHATQSEVIRAILVCRPRRAGRRRPSRRPATTRRTSRTECRRPALSPTAMSGSRAPAPAAGSSAEVTAGSPTHRTPV